MNGKDNGDYYNSVVRESIGAATNLANFYSDYWFRLWGLVFRASGNGNYNIFKYGVSAGIYTG